VGRGSGVGGCEGKCERWNMCGGLSLWLVLPPNVITPRILPSLLPSLLSSLLPSTHYPILPRLDIG